MNIYYGVIVLKQDKIRYNYVMNKIKKQLPELNIHEGYYWKTDWDKIKNFFNSRDIKFYNYNNRPQGKFGCWASFLNMCEQIDKQNLNYDYYVFLQDDAIIPNNFEIKIQNKIINSK